MVLNDVTRRLQSGVVIPAHPLALNSTGHVDLTAQRALTKYYLAAGAHGVAVGVHTTQFELHNDPALLDAVWRVSADVAGETDRDPLLVAGLCGDVAAATAEAERAAAAGYHAALLCPWGMSRVTEEGLIERARAVGQILPTIGFYLQDAVGGVRLGGDYWRRLFDVESVIGVKVAPFDRYRTNDVLSALIEHDRWADVAVLTGNDDTIVPDLLIPHRRRIAGHLREVRAGGGLLGQWAVGTNAAVRLVADIWQTRSDASVPAGILATASELLEVNAAVFDAENGFAGCVPGVNEVLHQQGLLSSSQCMGDRDVLSPGQRELIADVRRRFPDLLDEEFIAAHRESWLS